MLTLNLENRFTAALPADPVEGPGRRQVREALYSRVQPEPAPKPELIGVSLPLMADLGLAPELAEDAEFVRLVSGGGSAPGLDPHATAYGGHQFGQWAGQLGDGRAINLGELRDTHDQLQMLQLKGAGPTPYSRTADGYAVLRSSVREFLCSEAMHHLGIPTTRALTLCSTGNNVLRDMFYDGNAAFEPGAVVCRVAPSFIRFGHFELLTARQEVDLLKQLTEYTIQQHWPELTGSPIDRDVVLTWFEDVCARTAELVARWMSVGFVHGVLNTDNMSIHGLTIDYGPYGWLDEYEPGWTPNTSDNGRRYCYENQPAIGQWNLIRLANALYPLIDDAKPLEDILHRYADHYEQHKQQLFARKLGWAEPTQQAAQLIESLEGVLTREPIDMTMWFRLLADVDPDAPFPALFEPAFYGRLNDPDALSRWLTEYAEASRACPRDVALMNRSNPRFILRNYLTQQAISDLEQGDAQAFDALLSTLQRPFDDADDDYFAKRPEWAVGQPGCSMLSCSS